MSTTVTISSGPWVRQVLTTQPVKDSVILPDPELQPVESPKPIDTETNNNSTNEQRGRQIMSTPVFVKDDIAAWRPASLLNKNTNVSKEDEDLSEEVRTVLDDNVPSVEYTMDYHKRVLAPKIVTSPFRNKNQNNKVELITKNEKNPYQVTDVSDYDDGILPLQDVDQDGNMIMRDNLADIPYLHEASILYNLARRNETGIPYTRAGSVMISYNPQRWIKGMYSEEQRAIYSRAMVWAPKYATLSLLPPHIYEVSSLAYKGMIIDGNDQSIVVSGETGAGKTETVKILMSHLATFDQTSPSLHSIDLDELHDSAQEEADTEHHKRRTKFHYKPKFLKRIIKKGLKRRHKKATLEPVCPETTSDWDELSVHSQPETFAKLNRIVERVLDADTLLEAFGNAKTQKNDNSSRFSKYTRLQFQVEFLGGAAIPTCTLVGSTCSTYLLQKSRVAQQDSGERNFHIFYQLLAAPDKVKEQFWPQLVGTTPADFRYLGIPDTDIIEGVNDKQRFMDTLAAMDVFDIDLDSLTTLMKAICAVLQLGNLVFDNDPENDEGCVITSSAELEKCADIIGIEKDVLVDALTTKKVIAPNQTYNKPLTSTQAKDTCDSFAKTIYLKAFAWLVRTINVKTSSHYNNDLIDYLHSHAVTKTVGLLDIFGFETFTKNHFEQMVVNHANEKLQHKFIEDVFSSVQDEYSSEGIPLQDIVYEDNIDILTCIEGKLGLIDILNEECFRPKGSDFGFVNKIYLNAKNKDSDDKETSPLYTKRDFLDFEFGVRHFAGPVRYDATQFVMKNMDDLSPSIVNCGCQSSNDLIRAAFNKMTKKKSSVKKETVWGKFSSQMNTLMNDINMTERRYVKCIVPNRERKAKMTDLPYTLTQLKSAGVMSAVTISRAAFPNRMGLETALSRFAYLMRGKGDDDVKEMMAKTGNTLHEKVDALLEAVLRSREDLFADDEDITVNKAYVIGKTKVYFRTGVLERLEEERLTTFDRMATVIQSYVRRRIAIDALMIMKKKQEMGEDVTEKNADKKDKKKKKKKKLVKIFKLGGKVLHGLTK